MRARARSVYGARIRREVSLAPAESRRKLSAPARIANSLPGPGRRPPSISTQSEERRARARKHTSVGCPHIVAAVNLRCVIE